MFFDKAARREVLIGLSFVPSSLGLIASTTPAEFKQLVSAFYFLPDKWNAFLNWLPFPSFLAADVVNVIILGLFFFALSYSTHSPKNNNIFSDVWGVFTNKQYSNKIKIDLTRSLLFGFSAFCLTGFIFLNLKYNWLKVIVIIVVIATVARKNKHYRKALLISIGVLCAMQLFYWGNFTPWIDYL